MTQQLAHDILQTPMLGEEWAHALSGYENLVPLAAALEPDKYRQLTIADLYTLLQSMSMDAIEAASMRALVTAVGSRKLSETYHINADALEEANLLKLARELTAASQQMEENE